MSSQICSPDIIRAQKEVGEIQTCRADLTRTPAEADGSRRKLTEAGNWEKHPLNRPILDANFAQGLLALQICSPDIIQAYGDVAMS